MSFEVDKDFALLYGIMLGDGCLSITKRKNRKSPTKLTVITGSSRMIYPSLITLFSLSYINYVVSQPVSNLEKIAMP